MSDVYSIDKILDVDDQSVEIAIPTVDFDQFKAQSQKTENGALTQNFIFRDGDTTTGELRAFTSTQDLRNGLERIMIGSRAQHRLVSTVGSEVTKVLYRPSVVKVIFENDLLIPTGQLLRQAIFTLNLLAAEEATSGVIPATWLGSLRQRITDIFSDR